MSAPDQTEAVQAQAMQVYAFSQGRQEQMPILVIAKDLPPFIPASRDVVDGSRIFESDWTCQINLFFARHPSCQVSSVNPVNNC